VVDCLKRHGVRGQVLDYGAGPSPVLTVLLAREGFNVRGYDPNFTEPHNPCSITSENSVVDAVVSTEVFEHFRDPAREMDRIARLLRPDGLLVVMTALVTEDVSLDTWHYTNDATHIVFYTEGTFEYIARRWGFRVEECDGGRLVVLRRGDRET
jgi:2-polyprenyl-3-methyl-5-hydroxy-6-metoxy-1,4-benzoquinol methylase